MYAHDWRASTRRLLTAFVITTLALALAVPAASAAPKTKLISQSTGGDQATFGSSRPDISGNGNIVVFHTLGDLLGHDDNSSRDVYRRVVGKSKTKLVSRARDGGLGDDRSQDASISANGRYVAFRSRASNLTPGGVDYYQVYRRSLVTGKTKLASKGASGVADTSCGRPSVSASGRYVVFSSRAENLSKKDTYGDDQVYLRDMKREKTYLISQNSKGTAGDGHSFYPVVSADGRFVAFQSIATNLSPKDERGVYQVFLRDRKLKKTSLISKNPSRGKAGDGDSRNVAMSDDGRIIVFESEAENLIKWGKDSFDFIDVYKYDRTTKKMSRASVNWKGWQLKGVSYAPDVSADGKVIVFTSEAINVTKGGNSGNPHTFRRGPLVSSIKLVDRNNSGQRANGPSWESQVSADGRYVTYHSVATNLTRGTDDNGSQYDVFRTGPY